MSLFGHYVELDAVDSYRAKRDCGLPGTVDGDAVDRMSEANPDYP